MSGNIHHQSRDKHRSIRPNDMRRSTKRKRVWYGKELIAKSAVEIPHEDIADSNAHE